MVNLKENTDDTRRCTSCKASDVKLVDIDIGPDNLNNIMFTLCYDCLSELKDLINYETKIKGTDMDFKQGDLVYTASFYNALLTKQNPGIVMYMKGDIVFVREYKDHYCENMHKFKRHDLIILNR